MKSSFLFTALLIAAQASYAGSIKGVVKAQLTSVPPAATVT